MCCNSLICYIVNDGEWGAGSYRLLIGRMDAFGHCKWVNLLAVGVRQYIVHPRCIQKSRLELTFVADLDLYEVKSLYSLCSAVSSARLRTRSVAPPPSTRNNYDDSLAGFWRVHSVGGMSRKSLSTKLSTKLKTKGSKTRERTKAKEVSNIRCSPAIISLVIYTLSKRPCGGITLRNVLPWIFPLSPGHVAVVNQFIFWRQGM